MAEKGFQLNTNQIETYKELGFAIVDLYNEEEVTNIRSFGENWIYNLLSPWVEKREDHLLLGDYHIWSERLPSEHRNVFNAPNRHTLPNKDLENTLINVKLKKFLTRIGINVFDLWDEGLGWLAFRFIRPGRGDGYPWSRKSWGPAKSVISAWVPVIGHSARETLKLIPGSHVKKYRKYLPENSKFQKDEYRLADPIPEAEIFSPTLKSGQVILFHPRVLHTEDVADSELTRLNLEFRINPQ
jgi:hypothetical protein